jgi:hypothetical protein
MIHEEASGEGVRCPVCGASDEEGCKHVLACVDQTFGECEGGFAFDNWWSDSKSRIEEVFRACAEAEGSPDWSCGYVREAWQAVADELYGDEDDVFLDAATVTDLLIYVLEESGGTEVGSGLIGPSGGRCDSMYRLLYAERPEEVCRRAAEMLDRFLRDQ